jgi:hypothetical protein
MMRPLVKLTSSRICIIPSQLARFTAGPTNEQMSRSLRSFLLIRFVALALKWVLVTCLTGGNHTFTHGHRELRHLIKRGGTRLIES